jgi:hypothetical protein
MESVDLSKLNGGVILDMMQEELRKVLDNIGDENVKPDAAREITMKCTIKPDKQRRVANIAINVSSKLAQIKPSESLVFLDIGKSGSVEMFQDNTKQLELNENDDQGIYTMPKQGAM